jgi:hypothetical protein
MLSGCLQTVTLMTYSSISHPFSYSLDRHSLGSCPITQNANEVRSAAFEDPSVLMTLALENCSIASVYYA